MTLDKRFRIGQVVTLDGSDRVVVVKISNGGYHVHVAPRGGGYATAISESEARKRLLGDHEDPKLARLTAKQRDLLERVQATGGFFVHGGDVRIAQVLEKLGLVELDDNGHMADYSGRSDRERWMVKPVGVKP